MEKIFLWSPKVTRKVHYKYCGFSLDKSVHQTITAKKIHRFLLTKPNTLIELTIAGPGSSSHQNYI